MGKIVFVGICCLDIVNYLEEYPAEDSDNRSVEQTITLGGNATNSSKVSSQLNNETFLFSAIPNKNPIFENKFAQFGFENSRCVVRNKDDDERGVPMTIVLVNKRNGSRTMFSSLIDLSWPTAEEFRKKFPDISEFSWAHFEIPEAYDFQVIKEMIEFVQITRDSSKRSKPTNPKISIEFEQPLSDHWARTFIEMADVIFVAKDFAKHKGWNSMEECVGCFQEYFNAHNKTVVCPWAEMGAAAKAARYSSSENSNDSEIIVASGHCPSGGRVIDTLAAGDCFIASCVHFLNQDLSLQTVLAKATFIAGESVGQKGLQNLKLE